MFRLFLPGAFGFIMLLLWLYAIVDVISTDESLARNLPKGVWLLLVIFIPTIGSLCWLILGRPMYAGWRPGDTSVRPVRAARGPEDDPSWGRSAMSPDERLRAWEDDLRRREADLDRRRRDERATGGGTDPKPDDPPPGEGFDFRW